MPLKFWGSPAPKTPFAPRWRVPMFVDKWQRPDLVGELRDLILAKEDSLKQASRPVAISGVEDGLTAHWHAFNIFAWPEAPAREMAAFVRQAYLGYLSGLGVPRQPVFVQGWANVLRSEETLSPHAHDLTESSYLSGNMCLTENGTETRYYAPYSYARSLDPAKSMALRNEPGALVLFPSSLFHETTPNRSGAPRVTIGFDIFLEDADVMGRQGSEGLHVPLDDARQDSISA